ncbi:MAG: DEAD/DEAH box helicase family protein, partial [Huintestinicola sp.]
MELRTLLTPEEYAAARKSTMNAHYTSPIIISAIYEGLKNLGFEKGKILEPAVGIGNFFGAMPEELRGSKLYGVELDSLTGRIAKQLYPEADIQIKGFEETIYNDNSFDVAIGNVPFGDYKLNDRRYNDNNFLIHDYFFAKALDKVHPGGIVAFVTSKGTLDKENPEVRKYLAQRAELLGAIRLPNNAFKANAGTETTADIIFLQKRERPIEIDPDEVEWLKKEDNPDGFFINNYFVQHPEMVLGKIAEARQIYGPTENTQVLPIEGADLKQQLAEAIKNLQGEYRAAAIETAERNDDEIPAPANSRKYSFYAVDGNLYYREAEDTMKKVNVPKDTLNRAIGLIELRDAVRNLLNLQLNNADGSLDIDIAESRKALNNAYDSFVAKYGNVSDRKNAKAMQGDDGYNIVSALELKDEKGQVTGKADIFTHNTVKPKILTSHVDTAEEALILSIAEKAKVDFEYMTSLCGMAKDKLISELSGQIFRLPQEEEEYVTADEYLTGNIRKKLRELEYAPEDMDVSENRKALEAAMPPRVEAKDISVKLGAHWVDPKYIEDFIKEKFNPDYDTRRNMSVQYSAVAGTWKIEDVKPSAKKNYYCTHTYGTHRKNAYELLEAILNNGDIQVKDRVKDENGNDMRDANGKYILVINDEETKAARRCANMIKSEFQDWIFKDPDRREALVQKYNEVYNSIRHREYDGSHLNFSGMNAGITLKEHQKNAVARGLYGGNCLLAHAVGAGKTFEMIAIAMEGKRLGLHHKCLFAVPNALTEQFGSDFRKLYPNANILVATQKDFEKANRLQLFGKIAANDWDAVIVGHSQFDRMGLSLEKERAYLVEEVNKLRYELEMATDANGGKKSFTVKQIEKSIAAYEDKLEKLNDAQVKDGFIDFEQLGFDKVFVDESHMYKNLATATKMHNVSGLGTQGSARAFNLLMKSKYLDELTGGRGLTFASGTPIITGYQRSKMPILRCYSSADS